MTHRGESCAEGGRAGPAGALTTHRVDGVDQLARLTELHEALAQVVERTLHQHLLLFVVVQQVIPQRLLGEGFGVPHDDHAVSEPEEQAGQSARQSPAAELLLGKHNSWRAI